MAYPNKPQITYSYTGFQQSQGNNSFPGTQLDADLANLKQFASTTVDFLALFVNSDGSLKSTAIIGSTALSDAITQAESAAATAAASSEAAAARAAQSQTSANAASASASDAATTAANLATIALLKSSNLGDLTDASAARVNLGLTAFATKTSLVIGDFASNLFTADTAGRAPFADGIWTTAKIANDAVDYTKVAAGMVVGQAYASSGAVATTTTTLPNDDTIPQITEGAEFLTVSITPKSATNILRITAEITCSPSVSSNMCAAIFRDATANALGCGFSLGAGGSEVRRIVVTVSVVAGSTAATTFRLRAGMGSAGTLTINGSGGTRLFGGAALTTLSVTEFKA